MTEMRRVLMIGDTVGGVWSYGLELARALGEGGVEVVLAAMGGEASAAQRAEAARVLGLVLRDRDLALEWMDDPWSDMALAGRWLLELEDEVAPDVVHVNGFAHAALPFRAPVIAVAHSSVDSWFWAVKGAAMPKRYRRYALEAARGLEAAELVVAPSRAMLRDLERTYGRIAGARVIPNGLFAERFRPRQKEPFVLAAARPWDEAKNVSTLARAAARLRWPVELAGARPGERLPEGLRSLGRLGREALARRMSRASVFAHPARYEPFGLAAVEAALSGCALVLGDIPSLREVWGDAAIFVPPADVVALGEALHFMIEDGSARAEAAERARRRALGFSARAMARSYVEAYDEIRASGRRSASKVMARS